MPRLWHSLMYRTVATAPARRLIDAREALLWKIEGLSESAGVGT